MTRVELLVGVYLAVLLTMTRTQPAGTDKFSGGRPARQDGGQPYDRHFCSPGVSAAPMG